MRSCLAAVLVLCSGLLSFPAMSAVWEQRVLMDEDAFVSLGQDALEREPVQDALTRRINDEVLALAKREGLDVALVRAASPQIAGVVVAELPQSNIGRQALRRTHQLAAGVIREDEVLETQDGLVVLDLREVVAGVLSKLGVAGLIDPRLVPEDAGKVLVVREQDVGWTLEWLRLFDTAAPYLAIAPIAVLLLVLLVAPERGRWLAYAGVLLLLCALLRIGLVLGPGESLVVDDVLLRPEARESAKAVYEVFARSYLTQELVVCGACVLAIALGLVLPRRRA